MLSIFLSRRRFLAASTLAAFSHPARAEPAKAWKFSFGSASAAPGFTPVAANAVYSKERGFGFEPGANVNVDRYCTCDKPFYFSIALPEGNYTVTLSLGDSAGESSTTVKAELRRLMLESITTAKGKIASPTFAVNVRTAKIPGGGEVKLKDREKTAEAWAWDEKLTLEFNGPRTCLGSIEIMAADVPTVYLLGDSTVCDQPREPYASWGQMLPRFFTAKVAVANHAESGESIHGAIAARRVEKVLATLHQGDYLFLQFGHNDMKSTTAEAYKADLKRVAAEARKKGGTPVLITPMHRRSFKEKVIVNSLKDFPDAVRELAKEERIPIIDLHAMSKVLYEALGPEQSGQLFKPGDGTHHSNYGAYQLARCVVEGIRQNKLAIAEFLAADAKPFDPSRPDAFAEFKVPASPLATTVPPEGK